MKFFNRFICTFLAFTFVFTSTTFAGEMGYFGGISEGTRLPKTTETLLNQSTSKAAPTSVSLVYKEVVFLSGKPVVFEGLLTVKKAVIDPLVPLGTATETYSVKPSASTSAEVSIDRNITFDVNYRIEGSQTIKDYEMKTWTETVKTPDSTYKIDARQSRYGISIIEDETAGVVYHKGNVSERAVYTSDAVAAEGAADTAATKETTTLETSGSFYGYDCAWSSTQTHRIDATVFTNDWQMQYQIRPSVSVTKTLQYDKNEPTAISFDGNYKEVMQNTSGLEYDIFVKPKQFLDVPDTGVVNIASYNTFEQLIAPDLSYLKGHFAEYDIKKLFAMQVLSGDPKFYKPEQAITRGQYVTALVKAIKLPITPVVVNKKAKATDVVSLVFPDVTPDRPEYPYIMAAYKAGLAVGRENGNFYIDKPIDRQEAFVILLRTLGLANLGLDPTPTTKFTDDYKIATWAKKEIYAAEKIGLITGDTDGNIKPKDLISKAAAAAIINRLIDYMRSDLALDYTEHIVNYAN